MTQSAERTIVQDVRLEDILITTELASRNRDRKSGYRTIRNSAEASESEIRHIVEPLVRAACEICSAGSAGMSLLETTPSGASMLRWIAVAGALSPCTGYLVARDSSPCGACLDSRAAALYACPGRYFKFLDTLPHPTAEALVVPIHSSEGCLGSLWMFAHEQGRGFSENDAAVLTGLADLAAIVLGRCMAEDFRFRRQCPATAAGDTAAVHDRPSPAAGANAPVGDVLRDMEQHDDELFTLLGHELRQPLSSMITALHLIRHGGLASRSVDMLERQVDRLVLLVDELLDDSPPAPSSVKTRLRTKPVHEPVEIRNTVARAVDAVRPSLYAHRHTFGVSLPEKPIWILGDSKRLQDVIGTLLGYAARSTEPGGCVWLTATSEQGEAVISVSDNGDGIPAEALPHLFESFQHSDPWLKRSVAGYRAGLVLARRWVEMHGGRIEARSMGAGQGSEFIVRLPLNGPGACAGGIQD